MSDTYTGMKPLELRKQLLVAESDLNRLQWAAESASLTAGLHSLTHGASSVGAMASSAMHLAADLTAIPHKRHAVGKKTLRLQAVLNGTVLISTIWLALLSRKT